jgi:hypothetical protein
MRLGRAPQAITATEATTPPSIALRAEPQPAPAAETLSANPDPIATADEGAHAQIIQEFSRYLTAERGLAMATVDNSVAAVVHFPPPGSARDLCHWQRCRPTTSAISYSRRRIASLPSRLS